MKHFVIDRNEFVPTSEWSISNALHMMKLSYAVYAGTTDNIGLKEDWFVTQKLVSDAGYEFQKIEASKGIYEPNAMVCSDEKSVFLIFRGTEPTAWNQWAIDAKTLRRPFCIGEAHRGFQKAVDLIWPDIMNCISRADPNRQKQLFVGGHSLGAGMSQVASAKLAFIEQDRAPAAVYHFGCPRALDSDGARLYDQRLGSTTYRVVNNNDIVCKVPLKIMGFSDVGQLRYMTHDGRLLNKLSVLQSAREWFWGRNRALTELNPADFATDHLPQHYTESLIALLD